MNINREDRPCRDLSGYSLASHRGGPGSSHVGFVVDKVALGRVFSEYFGFPCQLFHQFLNHHNHPGLAQ
jgi:hypothetical protein